MAADLEAPTRDKLLFTLKMRGAQTTAQLARRLRVTPMAIRQHMARLLDEGMVDRSKQSRGVGRPASVWALAEAARDRFPDTHGALSVEILASVREAFGDEGLERVIQRRTRTQKLAYQEQMPARDTPLAERGAALARLRTEDGYMAEWKQRSDGSFVLLENHCPICAAATACQGLCRDELSLFRSLLGPDASVRRTEHLLAGARRCAYEVRPRTPRRR